jgi:hypothetical protein
MQQFGEVKCFSNEDAAEIINPQELMLALEF